MLDPLSRMSSNFPRSREILRKAPVSIWKQPAIALTLNS